MTKPTLALIDLSTEVTRTNSGIWQHRGSIDLDSVIIIGFSPTNYHGFIRLGTIEWHPRMSFNRVKLRQACPRSIRASLFFVISGIEAARLEGFAQYLRASEGKRSKSCYHGIREALDKGLGITLNHDDGQPRDLEHFISGIMQGKLIAAQIGPLAIQAYTTRRLSLAAILHEVRHFQRHFLPHYLLSTTLHRLIEWLAPLQLLSHQQAPAQTHE